MHYSIVIISNNIKEVNFEDTLLIDNNNLSIIDQNTIIYENQTIYFDYLVIESDIKNSLGLLKDNNKYITNCYHQTSKENIFAIGKASYSTKKINNQLNDIYDFLTYN